MGFTRQLAAILACGSRKDALAAIKVPTLVIHGSHDALLPLAHGKDTAAAVPGAKLIIIQGLGMGWYIRHFGMKSLKPLPLIQPV